ncbi:pentatricopeptide repeat-containing protein [Dorcoceras hygrometricum]|uniref:Pentatricopeptide repeat-containing protein n=1 Tax=Dorcoceras hygrometricum TaxID=472368 RepID=A0A2Z7D5H8_9LAMI|nr:pentatricopeptide repeat-containing protein [Dorcoceras hygrometricum]
MHVPFSYNTLIQIYTKNRALKPGKSLHAHLIINGSSCSSYIASELIAFYTQCKQLALARKVFDRIPKSVVRGWVAIIGSYSRDGHYQEAINVFAEMLREGFKCDRIVLPSVLKACGQLCDRRTGERLHCVALKSEFEADAFVTCALIDMYSKCGAVGWARSVFYDMVEKDLVAVNAMVSGYVRNGVPEKALGLIDEMKLWRMIPDIVTWNTLISGFSQANDDIMVHKVFQMMDANGIKPDVVTWTAVISGLVQNFRNEEAIATFRQMLEAGIFSTSATISGLLPAAATMANLGHGKAIHGHSVVMGYEGDMYVRSALVDMYARCGLIDGAKSLFLKMSKRNSVAWNSMIFGYANHGYCHEAIELFKKMLTMAEKELDHLTFTAVLMACAHSGKVDLGESFFQMMQEKYQITPRLEHYACMVDLLGKAGMVSEAYEFIQTMPIEPDLFVWGAFLGACRHHGWVDMAEIAAKQLAKLEPGSAGSSVLLFNLYMDSKKVGNALKVKKVMKKRKLRSFPSCSWIEAM